MSGAPRDQEARDRAVREHETHLAVEAGAGTGKTTLLVDRIVAGLQAERLTMPRLAAITFTRKAAGELRTRLRARIAKAREHEDSELLERARRELPLGRVSTIHSFCSRILRQNPIAAGLDPDFDVVDDGRHDEQFEELWRRWLAEAPRGTGAEDVAEAIAAGASSARLAEVARLFVESPDVAPPGEEPGPGADELWRAVRDVAAGLARDATAICRDDARDNLEAGLRHLLAVLESVERYPPSARMRWLARRVVRDSGNNGFRFRTPEIRSKGSKNNFTDLAALDELRERLEAWTHDELPELIRRHHAEAAARTARALAGFRDWARRERIARGTLAQNDLLEEARRLLADRGTGALARLAADLDVLMIDEYQDTDPIQASIVRMLREHERGPKVFVVGDPKQSIYRFRRADVLTYMQDVDDAERAGALERIYVNFRSRAALLDALDPVGREVMEAADGGGRQATWQRLEASETTSAGRAGPSVVLVPTGPSDETLSSAELSAREASALANALHDARKDGYAWREMAVLFAASSHLAALEDALDAGDVPYRQEKSRDFFRRIEIAEIGHLVTAVADPWDETAIVGLLRSRILGVSDEALLAHATGGGRFVAAGVEPEAGVREVRVALGRIATWHEWSRKEPPPVLLREIVRETGYLTLLAGLPHGGRDVANLRKLLDTAEVRWSEGDAGVTEFARWMRVQLASDTVREAESPSAEEEDRVSLLTVHAAKGMEWHVVGLYDLHAGGRTARPSGVVERGRADPPRLAVALSTVMRTSRFDALQEEDRQLADAERARLLYVALTRARERVVVPFPATVGNRPASGSFHELLRRSPTWTRWEEAARAGRDPDPPHVAVGANADPGGARAPRRTQQASDVEARKAAAARAAWIEARRSSVARADRLVVTVPSDLHAGDPARIAQSGSSSAAKIGSAVHRALEWLVTGALDDVGEAARRAAEQLVLKEDEAIANVNKMVVSATESPLWSTALRAERRFAELPFAWPTTHAALPAAGRTLLADKLRRETRPEPESDDPVVVEGVADLVFVCGELLTVVDYKTDAWKTEGEREDLVRRYRPQLSMYRAVLSTLSGVREVRAVLLLLGGRRPEEVEADLAE